MRATRCSMSSTLSWCARPPVSPAHQCVRPHDLVPLPEEKMLDQLVDVEDVADVVRQWGREGLARRRHRSRMVVRMRSRADLEERSRASQFESET